MGFYVRIDDTLAKALPPHLQAQAAVIRLGKRGGKIVGYQDNDPDKPIYQRQGSLGLSAAGPIEQAPQTLSDAAKWTLLNLDTDPRYWHGVQYALQAAGNTTARHDPKAWDELVAAGLMTTGDGWTITPAGRARAKALLDETHATIFARKPEEPPAPHPKPRAPNKRDGRLPAPGTVMTGKHKGVAFECVERDGLFHLTTESQHAGTHRSLSGAAAAAMGHAANGFAFFGLGAKQAKEATLPKTELEPEPIELPPDAERYGLTENICRWAGVHGKGEKLGSGTAGTAFRFGDKVIKMTRDPAEATSSYAITGKHHPNVEHVFKVGRIKNPDTDKRLNYALVLDYLEPLTQDMKDAARIDADWGRLAELPHLPKDLDAAVEALATRGLAMVTDAASDAKADFAVFLSEQLLGYNAPGTLEQKAAAVRADSKYQDILRHSSEIIDGMAFLAANGIVFRDTHAGNMRSRNGQVVLIDLGYSKSNVKPDVLEEIEKALQYSLLGGPEVVRVGPHGGRIVGEDAAGHPEYERNRPARFVVHAREQGPLGAAIREFHDAQRAGGSRGLPLAQKALAALRRGDHLQALKLAAQAAHQDRAFERFNDAVHHATNASLDFGDKSDPAGHHSSPKTREHLALHAQVGGHQTRFTVGA